MYKLSYFLFNMFEWFYNWMVKNFLIKFHKNYIFYHFLAYNAI